MLDPELAHEAQALVLNVAFPGIKRLDEAHPAAHRIACSLVQRLCDVGSIDIVRTYQQYVCQGQEEPDDFVDAVIILQETLFRSIATQELGASRRTASGRMYDPIISRDPTEEITMPTIAAVA